MGLGSYGLDIILNQHLKSLHFTFLFKFLQISVKLPANIDTVFLTCRNLPLIQNYHFKSENYNLAMILKTS